MKKFIFNFIIFILPFSIYFFVVYLVDPYNFYNKSSEIKEINLIAKKVEPHLYKLIEFNNQTKKNILLGDSRTNNFHKIFTQNHSENWSNLAYGGASLKEMIETFWHANNKVKLDTVVIGLNFLHFDEYNSKNWIMPTLNIMENSISYSFSKYVFSSILELNFSSKEDNNIITSSEQDISWNNHVNFLKKFYKRINYPKKYSKQLKEISIFCRNNDIKLIVWVSPVHDEIHDIILDYDLLDNYDQFINELSSLGIFYNFDNNLEIRSNKLNFNDATHISKIHLKNIYKKIFAK